MKERKEGGREREGREREGREREEREREIEREKYRDGEDKKPNFGDK